MDKGRIDLVEGMQVIPSSRSYTVLDDSLVSKEVDRGLWRVIGGYNLGMQRVEDSRDGGAESAGGRGERSSQEQGALAAWTLSVCRRIRAGRTYFPTFFD